MRKTVTNMTAAGVILCNKTIRHAIVHSSRCLTYSGAPSTLMVASIRCGYALLTSGETRKVCNPDHPLTEGKP